jgi:hypothetical protein
MIYTPRYHHNPRIQKAVAVFMGETDWRIFGSGPVTVAEFRKIMATCWSQAAADAIQITVH